MPCMHSRTAGRSGNRRRGGFILLRTLTAFMIALMMVPLCMRCISAMPYLFSKPLYVQDEIAALQLRRVFALSEQIEVHDSYVDFTYQKRRMSLHMSNDNIIISPGTQICFTEVSDCRFAIRGGILVIIIEREDSGVEKVLSPLS